MQVNIGKGIDLEVPAFESLAKEVRDHIAYIGWRNILMDSHASITPQKANGGDVQAMSRAVAEKKLQSLINGEVRTVAVREGDPVKAEAIRLADIDVRTAIRKRHAEGKGPKLSDIADKAIRAKAKELVEARPKYMEKARENIAAAKSADIDLDDLAI